MRLLLLDVITNLIGNKGYIIYIHNKNKLNLN